MAASTTTTSHIVILLLLLLLLLLLEITPRLERLEETIHKFARGMP